MSRAVVADVALHQQPGLLKRVQEMLGVHRLRSDEDLVRLSRSVSQLGRSRDSGDQG